MVGQGNQWAFTLGTSARLSLPVGKPLPHVEHHVVEDVSQQGNREDESFSLLWVVGWEFPDVVDLTEQLVEPTKFAFVWT
jgi:hypothetical protein